MNEYFILVRDRYTLWAKGPYATFGQAASIAEKMIEEDDTNIITSATICHSVAEATLQAKEVIWETSEYT